MKNRIDIHNYERKLEQETARVSTLNISERNKKIVFKFRDYCFAQGLSQARIWRYLQLIPKIAFWLEKDLDKATTEDILRVVQIIEKNDFTYWTKYTYKRALKRFYKWLGKKEDYPKEVKWIKCNGANGNHKLPEELLTEEDIKKMISCANNLRDKALISMLYESGCRIGELGSLKIKHVSFDKYGTVLIIDGKTGMRRVRLITSTPYVVSWLEIHPLRDNSESPLWVCIGQRNRNQAFDYRGFMEIIKKLAKKAGITKRVYPHVFRHSRATYLSKHLTEAQMKQYFGWMQSSKMASVYVHLSGRDVDDALLKLYGIKDEEKKDESVLNPKKCLRCETINPATGRFCNKCGLPLDVKTAVELEEKKEDVNELMKTLIEQPEIQKILLEKMKELGLGDKLKGDKD